MVLPLGPSGAEHLAMTVQKTNLTYHTPHINDLDHSEHNGDRSRLHCGPSPAGGWTG